MKPTFIAGLVALLVTTAATGQPPSSRAVLRVHAALTEFHQGKVFADEDLFVLGDGSVTGSLTLSPEETCIGCGWASGIAHGSGTAQQFATLQQVLSTNAVGSQRGGCVAGAKLGGGTYEITWYGVARVAPLARRNIFVFQVNSDGPPCPASVVKIITAIETYASEAGVPVSDLWK
jgi:hypothetical protein